MSSTTEGRQRFLAATWNPAAVDFQNWGRRSKISVEDPSTRWKLQTIIRQLLVQRVDGALPLQLTPLWTCFFASVKVRKQRNFKHEFGKNLKLHLWLTDHSLRPGGSFSIFHYQDSATQITTAPRKQIGKHSWWIDPAFCQTRFLPLWIAHAGHNGQQIQLSLLESRTV